MYSIPFLIKIKKKKCDKLQKKIIYISHCVFRNSDFVNRFILTRHFIHLFVGPVEIRLLYAFVFE